MPETGVLTFTHKELVEILIKSQGLSEGIWKLYVKFGLRASNVGASDADLLPSAIIPILQIGLQRADKEDNLSADASKINPKAKKKKSRKK